MNSARLGGKAVSANPRVDFADHPKQVASKAGTQLHEQFAQVLESAHSSYQKTHLTLSPGESPGSEGGVKKRGAKNGHLAFRRILPTHADRTVTVPRRRICSRHRDTDLQPTSEVSEAFQIDLRFTKKGFKKVITKYTGSKMFCPKCRRSLPPRAILRSRVVYSATASRLGPSTTELSCACHIRQITAAMEEMFCERTSAATVVKFVRNLADFYGRCEKANLDRLLAGSVPPRR